jgi:hypothetical protein
MNPSPADLASFAWTLRRRADLMADLSRLAADEIERVRAAGEDCCYATSVYALAYLEGAKAQRAAAAAEESAEQAVVASELAGVAEASEEGRRHTKGLLRAVFREPEAA